jgi:CNT family concentrative nucleoside transporter
MPLLGLLLTRVALAEGGGQFIPHETSIVERLVSLFGVFAMVGIAWLLSERRRSVNWRIVGWGIGLQLLFGAIVLSPAASQFFFTVVNTAVNQLLEFSGEGATFVFQSVEPHAVYTGDVPSLLAGEGELEMFVGRISPPVKTFAFWILPTIVFFSSLMSVLYHLGVMQVIVRAIAKVMVYTMGTSGAETLSAAGNIFVGQTEAPLLIRPFVEKMTRSELMAVMTGGFATVAGGVMGAYVGFLRDIPNIAGHLVVASIISAPAALAIAKVMVPETEESQTAGELKVDFPQTSTNVIEAAANGAADGMKLAINVAAMLIAIVALVAMANWFIAFVPVTFCDDGVSFGYACAGGVEGSPMSLSVILGWLFAPIALLMGVPPAECLVVGRLLGEKIVLTEFIAYMNLSQLIASPVPVISERAAIISSYALCGFANFASIGIQLGGIGGIAPSRMGDLAALGFRAMIAGAIAACMTGAIAGVML